MIKKHHITKRHMTKRHMTKRHMTKRHMTKQYKKKYNITKQYNKQLRKFIGGEKIPKIEFDKLVICCHSRSMVPVYLFNKNTDTITNLHEIKEVQYVDTQYPEESWDNINPLKTIIWAIRCPIRPALLGLINNANTYIYDVLKNILENSYNILVQGGVVVFTGTDYNEHDLKTVISLYNSKWDVYFMDNLDYYINTLKVEYKTLVIFKKK